MKRVFCCGEYLLESCPTAVQIPLFSVLDRDFIPTCAKQLVTACRRVNDAKKAAAGAEGLEILWTS